MSSATFTYDMGDGSNTVAMQDYGGYWQASGGTVDEFGTPFDLYYSITAVDALGNTNTFNSSAPSGCGG